MLATRFGGQMQQGLSEAARRQDTSVVKAVAEAWRDDEPTITAVTKTWLSSAKSETILKTLIRGREVSVSAAPVADEYKAPLLLVASAEFALLIVVVSALYLAHRLSIALPAIVAIVLLMASGLLLISYWKKKPEERNPTFWWVASAIYLVQMGLAVPICRDIFFFEEQKQWGHHEFLWGLIMVFVGLLTTPAVAEPFKKLPSKVAKGQAHR